VTTTNSRPRDSAATQQRIIDAATEEFAAHGLAGARVATIATRASANPRMLYAYFESKEGLFIAVLERAVAQMRDSVTLDPADLVGYALDVFDAYSANTYLIRLALWQSLELAGIGAAIEMIGTTNDAKIAAIRAAQERGQVSRTLDAPRLLDAILTLAYGNLILADGTDNYSPERRVALAAAVGSLVAPGA
jgi:AcrR family transcriptional regulator